MQWRVLDGDHPNHSILIGCSGRYMSLRLLKGWRSGLFIFLLLSLEVLIQSHGQHRRKHLLHVMVSPAPPISSKARVQLPNKGIKRQDGQGTHGQVPSRISAFDIRDNQRCCHNTVVYLNHVGSGLSTGWDDPALVLGCRRWAVVMDCGFPVCVG